MAKTNQERFSELGLIITTLVWGLGFPITQLAFNHGFETFTILTARFLIGVIVLSILFFKKFKLMKMSYFIASMITGFFLFLGFYLQTSGLLLTTTSNNAFLTQVAVILTPFISWFMFRKKPSIYAFIAAFIAIIGIFMLVGGINLANFNRGDILTLGCAIAVSFHINFTQYFISKYKLDVILFTLLQFVMVAILSATIAYGTETLPSFNQPILSLIWPLIFIGLLNTAFGFTMQTYAIKFIESSRTSIIVSMEALVGTIASLIILNEKISLNILVGGIIIILALIISETKLDFIKKRFKTRD